MKVIHDTVENIQRNPFKSLVTILSVAIGVGILILTLSVSEIFNTLLNEKITSGGRVLTVSNSALQTDGTYSTIRPSQLDRDAQDIVRNEVEGVLASSIIFQSPWNEVLAGDKRYTIRNIYGTDAAYTEVMELTALAGQFFTQKDVIEGNNVLSVSRDFAESIYGSIGNAIGQTIQPPSIGGQGRSTSRVQVPVFTIVAVYENPGELKQEAYAIADIIAPYTSLMVQGGSNLENIMIRIASTFVVLTENRNAESQIQHALSNAYGDDLKLNIWEGSPNRPSALLEETRNSIRIMTILINLLGFILLVSGAIGILSIMLVEILGKTKEISIERALGSNIQRIFQKFLVQSVMLSLFSAALGVVFAYIIGSPLSSLISSVFSHIDATEFQGALIRPAAIVVGLAAALFFGGIFGILPLFSIVRTPIAEGIREA